MSFERPINAIPPVVMALTLLIVGIECVFQLAENGLIGGPRAVGWRLQAVQDYGFSPAVLDRMMTNGDYSLNILRRFVTYPFLNMQLTQVAFCAALTLALGKFVGEYFGGAKVLFLYLFTSIVGAIVYGLLVSGRFPLIGGFTPVYGLIGAYTYVLWLRLGEAGENQLLAFRLIGVLLLIQLIYGIMIGFFFETPPPPAWIAELAGFFAGFGISVLLAPGGWAAFVNRMRQRS